jgi:hypothetical protein
MWFRDPNPGKNWTETAINIATSNLGPGVSTGLNLIRGVDDLSKGEILRGLEKLVPALFRTPITAYRIGTEGAETTKGADMLTRDELNNLNLIAQAIGFPPTRLARMQEQSFESQKETRKAQDRRAKVLDSLNRVAFDPEGDKADLKEVFEDIISKGIIKHAKTHFINSTIDIKDKIASENGTINIYLADEKVNYEFIGFSKNLVEEIKAKMS